jgi:hypothetical protein
MRKRRYRLWRSKCGGLDVSDLSRLKELESDNSQMERIITRQTLDIRIGCENDERRPVAHQSTNFVGGTLRTHDVPALVSTSKNDRVMAYAHALFGRDGGTRTPTAHMRSYKSRLAVAPAA